jgi:predicted nucleic acid-binding protein
VQQAVPWLTSSSTPTSSSTISVRIVREFGTHFPDAIIAATALEHGLGLVTRTRKHFDPIRGVRIRELG